MPVLLVRHAQSANNVLWSEVRSKGRGDWDEDVASYDKLRTMDPALSDLGLKQAEALATYFKANPPFGSKAISAVYASPMQRTALTIRPTVVALGVGNAIIRDDLYEVLGMYGPEIGDAAGYTARELRSMFPEFELQGDAFLGTGGWYTLGRAETEQEAMGRAHKIVSWLEELSTGGPEEHAIIICVHGDIIDLILRNMLGIDGSIVNGTMYPNMFAHCNTAFTLVNFNVKAHRWVVQFVNRCPHVTPEQVSGADMAA